MKRAELGGWLAAGVAVVSLGIQEFRNEMDAQRVAELELDRRSRTERLLSESLGDLEEGRTRETACYLAWAKDRK